MNRVLIASAILIAAESMGSAQEIADQAHTPPEVTFDRILRASEEPQNWLTYSGNLQGHRYSGLSQITRQVGVVSAEWPLTLLERLDRTRSEGGPAKKAGSIEKAVRKTLHRSRGSAMLSVPGWPKR